MILKTKSFLSPIIIAVGILLTGCSGSHSKPKSDSTHTAVSKADTSKPKLINAPDFTLKDSEGKPFTLSDHRGQIIVLNIWATWCGPCRKEIPDFIKIQKELRDKGVLFVGVSIDRKGWKVVRPFIKKFGINYPIMVDNGTVFRKYGPFRAIPVTFIITRKGKIAYGGAGMVKSKSLKRVLEKMASH